MNTSDTQIFYDYKRFIILYVDDEERSLSMFEKAYGSQFRILTATNAPDGLELLKQHKDEVGVLMTDQRMPGEKGVWLLEKARKECPMAVRILATAYSDMDAVIDAVNTGAIYRYVAKPWDPAELEGALKRGLEFFMVRRERDQLLRQQLSVLRNTLVADRIVSLGLLASGLSHHIRNALVAVKTFMDLTPSKLAEEKVDAKELQDPQFWRDYHGCVQEQIEKINVLLKELWSASDKPDLGFKDSLQLKEVVDEVIASHKADADQKQIDLSNTIPADLKPIHVDAPRFRRLFELLLKDEVAMLPAGCKVQVSAKMLPADRNEPERVEIEVTDDGPGLQDDKLQLVFDPFMVRNDSPAEYGIHLMSCFFIVHHHGGRIEAQNLPEGGTRFRIVQPLSPEESLPLEHDDEFLQKVLLNQTSWEQLIYGE